MLRRLQTSISQVLGAQSARACNALTFDLNNYGIDLDPHIVQFTRRMALLRRMYSKHPRIRADVGELWDFYHKGSTPGTIDPAFELSGPLETAPPPGHQGRAKWKPSSKALGPVALVLFSASQVASALDRDFWLHRYGRDPLDVFNMPQ